MGFNIMGDKFKALGFKSSEEDRKDESKKQQTNGFSKGRTKKQTKVETKELQVQDAAIDLVPTAPYNFVRFAESVFGDHGSPVYRVLKNQAKTFCG